MKIMFALYIIFTAGMGNNFSYASDNSSDNSSTIRKECLDAGLAKLRISRVAAFDSDRDYCQEGLIPDSIGKIIESLSVTNQKIATLLGIPKNKLFQTGLNITIESSDYGIMSSDSAITLGVFPNWSGQPIDQGVYAHEVGHVIFSDRQPEGKCSRSEHLRLLEFES